MEGTRSFYYLSIPKTGSAFFRGTIFSSLKEYLLENNIDVLNFGDHEGYGPVKDNTYTFSILRDPLGRTISHYCHEAISLEDDLFIEQNKNNLFLWMEKNKNRVSNFQSKNLLYTKSENLRGFGWMQISDEDFLNMTLDIEQVKKRVSSISLLVNSSDELLTV